MFSFKTLAVLLYASVFAVLALGAPTDTAKRSYVSAGLTCYFVCPSSIINVSIGTLTLGSTTTTSNGIGQCTYSLLLVSLTCQYDATTGAAITGNNIICPTPSVVCGNQPSNSFKKRHRLESKSTVNSPKGKRIAQRQYKFKRDGIASRQPGEKKNLLSFRSDVGSSINKEA